uniref:Uncharacterized protein n=1 Tax=Helianthus annuus TaxID=4232 RepID=A0A251S320_HELAN
MRRLKTVFFFPRLGAVMVRPCILPPKSQHPCYLISPNLFSHCVFFILPQATT